MKNIIITLFLVCTSFTCNSKPNRTEGINVSDTIPEGAITFEYDRKMMKMIILKGTLNDSIVSNFIFDTGWSHITVSDSLKPSHIKDSYIKTPTRIKIHDWANTYSAIEYFEKNHPFTKLYGANFGIIDWSIFENKIIKISYRYKYIRELADVNDLQEYGRVKINREGLRLVIPVNILYKGKDINELAIVDTGSNSYISFSKDIATKYNIDIDEATHVGGATMASGMVRGFSIVADTIMVANNYITKGSVAFSNRNIKYALLGNRFLENFDVVLDLKNYYLYLKPLDR